MLRLIGGTIAGVVVWGLLVTLLNLALRLGWPAYAAVEKAMAFSLPMLAARLAESGVASLLAGALAGRIARALRAGLFSGVVLLILFLPVHYNLWQVFPIWYHLIFLASLPLLGAAGARLTARTHPTPFA